VAPALCTVYVIRPSDFTVFRKRGVFLFIISVEAILNVMAHAQKTRFRLSAKLTSPLKSAGASVRSTTGSRVVRISGSNAGYTMFRGSVKSTGYPLHSPSFPLPCVTVCHHISTAVYKTAYT